MRLLLAEDERSLSKAIVTVLNKNNYSVDAVYDGEEALEYLQSSNYDGVILDIMMPKLDGIEVLRTLRARGDPTPVLVLSARSEVDDKVLGLDTGANDYLTKPFATRELLARIRAMTRPGPTQQSSVLTMGNITLNCASFQLSSSFGQFILSNKEFQIMEHLMRHPEQFVTAEHLLEHIWGYDSEAEVGVVWTYISYLRKKLIALHSNIEIRAKRNAGYILVGIDV